MPHTSSAKKRLRQNEKRHLQNKSVKSMLSTRRRRFVETVSSGDVASAEESLRLAQKAMDQAGSKGTIHKNTAARRISRLTKQLNALKAEAQQA